MELTDNIEVLNLPARIKTIAVRSGIETINDLLVCTKEDLWSFRGYGEKTDEDLFKILSAGGLKLDQDLTLEELNKRNRERSTGIKLNDGLVKVFGFDAAKCINELGIYTVDDLLKQENLREVDNHLRFHEPHALKRYCYGHYGFSFERVFHSKGLKLDSELSDSELLERTSQREILAARDSNIENLLQEAHNCSEGATGEDEKKKELLGQLRPMLEERKRLQEESAELDYQIRSAIENFEGSVTNESGPTKSFGSRAGTYN